ncbi:Cyclin-A2 [Linnemannia gamsii]|uniref:Cyclin-A2 n=1 Tax=Linnemannia gamsii TaxID=64522 RepID=A0ABQ7JRP7_9FUNG|nr:Cyclin-A2 [Linnemannia gamsii]
MPDPRTEIHSYENIYKHVSSVAINSTTISTTPREPLKPTGQENKRRLPILRRPLSAVPDPKRRYYGQDDGEVETQTTSMTSRYGGVNLLKLPSNRSFLPEQPSGPLRSKQPLAQGQAQAHSGYKPRPTSTQSLSEQPNSRMATGTNKPGYPVKAGSVSPFFMAMNTIVAAKTETTTTTRSTFTDRIQDISDRTTRRAGVIENEIENVPAQVSRSVQRLVAPLPSPGARHIQKAAAASKQPIAPLRHPQVPAAADVEARTRGCADVQLKSAVTEPTTTLTRREREDDAVGVGSADTRPGKRRREVDEFDDMKQALLMQEIEDPMLAGEYSDSIFSYMRELEIMLAPSIGYLESRPRNAWSVRRLCVDIACRVCDSLNTVGETVFLAVNLLDRYLSCRTLQDDLYQPRILIVTCVLVASKFEERNPYARAIDFLHILGRLGLPPLDPAVFCAGERNLLQFFDYKLGWPGPLSFLRRCSRADSCDQAARLVAKYIIEAILIDERFVLYRPSLQAASALYIGRSMQGREDWPDILIEYSGYSFSEMEPAVLDMIAFLSENHVTSTAPFYKYKTRRRSFVSLLVARWIERRSHIQIL